MQAQVINEYKSNNNRDSRYTLHDDGTVTDLWTDLIWQRCSLGQSWNSVACAGNASIYDWQVALQQGDSDTFAGYSDWRLPNEVELRSLVAYDRAYPAINATVFPNTPSSSYWSSSSSTAYSGAYAWVVYFNNGTEDRVPKLRNDTDYPIYARLVRGGQ